jgi:hypothetical protein
VSFFFFSDAWISNSWCSANSEFLKTHVGFVCLGAMNEGQAVLQSDPVLHNEIPVQNKVTFFFVVEFMYEYLLLFLMATFSNNFLFIMLCSNRLLSTLYERIVSYCIHFFEPSINFMSIFNFTFFNC